MTKDKIDHSWWDGHKLRVREDMSKEQQVECARQLLCRGWGDCKCTCIKAGDCHADESAPSVSAIPDGADWIMILQTVVDAPFMLGALVVLMAKGIREGVQAAAKLVRSESLDLENVNLLQTYHALMGLGMENSAARLVFVLMSLMTTHSMRVVKMMCQASSEMSADYPDGKGVVEAIISETHGWKGLRFPWQVHAAQTAAEMYVKTQIYQPLDTGNALLLRKYGPYKQTILKFCYGKSILVVCDDIDSPELKRLMDAGKTEFIITHMTSDPELYRRTVTRICHMNRLAELMRHFTSKWRGTIRYPHPVGVALDEILGTRIAREDECNSNCYMFIKQHGKDMLDAMAVPDPHRTFSTVCQPTLTIAMDVVREYLACDKKTLTDEESKTLYDKIAVFIGYPPSRESMKNIEACSAEKLKRDKRTKQETGKKVGFPMGNNVIRYWD